MVSILNKMERQNQMISFIQQGHKINASDLAKQFNVSTRTITRDIDDLESKGFIYTLIKEDAVDMKFKILIITFNLN